MLEQIATFGFVGNYLPLQQLFAMIIGVIWFFIVSQYRFKYWVFGIVLVIAFQVSEMAAMGDSPLIIIDEFAVIPLIFLGIRLRKDITSLLLGIGGIGLFGLLDWLKPLGISYLELLPGGIVLDDMGAALLACGILWLIIYISNFYIGKDILPTHDSR
ncbi:MAG: phosphatidylglycerophosphatase A [Candidatus Woesearchaeota archaeon]